MFLGTYRPKLISERRIALPKKVRREIKSNKIVLTVGFEKCIFGFDYQDWQQIVKPELERPLFSDLEGRNLRRKMCVEAMEIKLGAQGRVVIPKRMMKYAEVKQDLILIGTGDHFEIWNRKTWENYLKKIDQGSKNGKVS
jgi:MraZ protein